MAKITKQVAEQKLKEKVEAIDRLCKQMEILIEAGQQIDRNGFIKNVVSFRDIEQYDIVDDVLEVVDENKLEVVNENSELSDDNKTDEI
jgi:hypothetical protein